MLAWCPQVACMLQAWLHRWTLVLNSCCFFCWEWHKHQRGLTGGPGCKPLCWCFTRATRTQGCPGQRGRASLAPRREAHWMSFLPSFSQNIALAERPIAERLPVCPEIQTKGTQNISKNIRKDQIFRSSQMGSRDPAPFSMTLWMALCNSWSILPFFSGNRCRRASWSMNYRSAEWTQKPVPTSGSTQFFFNGPKIWVHRFLDHWQKQAALAGAWCREWYFSPFQRWSQAAATDQPGGWFWSSALRLQRQEVKQWKNIILQKFAV